MKDGSRFWARDLHRRTLNSTAQYDNCWDIICVLQYRQTRRVGTTHNNHLPSESLLSLPLSLSSSWSTSNVRLSTMKPASFKPLLISFAFPGAVTDTTTEVEASNSGRKYFRNTRRTSSLLISWYFSKRSMFWFCDTPLSAWFAKDVDAWETRCESAISH